MKPVVVRATLPAGMKPVDKEKCYTLDACLICPCCLAALDKGKWMPTPEGLTYVEALHQDLSDREDEVADLKAKLKATTAVVDAANDWQNNYFEEDKRFICEERLKAKLAIFNELAALDKGDSRADDTKGQVDRGGVRRW